MFYYQGFDEYGSNYRANCFVEPACYYNRTFKPNWPTPYGYDNDLLIMKWSDNWEPGFDLRDNPEQSMLTSISSFVKNFWKGDTVSQSDYTSYLDGGYYIWSVFVVIEEVWNNPTLGVTGI